MNAYSSTVHFTIKLRPHEMYIQYNCHLLAPILSINLKHATLLGKVTRSQNVSFFFATLVQHIFHFNKEFANYDQYTQRHEYKPSHAVSVIGAQY